MVWKKNDGKERDKQGRIVKVCGIDGCTYKTGRTTNMKSHKASKHGMEGLWDNDDGKERDKQGRIIRVCGIDGCTYKTGYMVHMKQHKASKHVLSQPAACVDLIDAGDDGEYGIESFFKPPWMSECEYCQKAVRTEMNGMALPGWMNLHLLACPEKPKSPPTTAEPVILDKWGNIVRVCGIAGCTYKTVNTGHMKRHKASKHGIEAVWKNDDGKERDKRGNVIRICGVAGCTYKTGHAVHMKQHKAAKHGIQAVWKNDAGKERDKQGRIVRVCGIAGCTYKGRSEYMRKHQMTKHGIEHVGQWASDPPPHPFAPLTMSEIELSPGSPPTSEPLDPATGTRLYEAYLRANVTYDPLVGSHVAKGDWAASKSDWGDAKLKSAFEMCLTVGGGAGKGTTTSLLYLSPRTRCGTLAGSR